MPDIVLTAKVDSTQLNRAISLSMEYSKRTPGEACNIAGYNIAVAAQKDTRYVPIPKIDAELSVIVAPVIGARGKPLKGKKKFRSAQAANEEMPFAAAIIQSRANPLSKYNELTGGQYAGPSPFKGKSRAAGRAAMQEAEHKLIARRHSSTHFLQAGWTRSINILRSYCPARYRSGGLPEPIAAGRGDNLGEAQPAGEGFTTYATISNLIGYEGKNAESFDRALQKYGGPPLQDATDNEGRRVLQYYLDHSLEETLRKPFNELCK